MSVFPAREAEATERPRDRVPPDSRPTAEALAEAGQVCTTSESRAL